MTVASEVDVKYYLNDKIECIKCFPGYSLDNTGICREIKVENCLDYDFQKYKCKLCNSGYRLKNNLNLQDNKKNEFIHENDGADEEQDEDARAERNKLEKKFNQELKSIRNIVNSANYSSCIQCADGCQTCRDFAYKNDRTTSFKQCVICKDSDRWPKWYHSNLGTCRAYNKKGSV